MIACPVAPLVLTPDGLLMQSTGITATLCCFPLDVLRTRVLSAPISQREGNYLAMLARIARKEGLPALYVGCAPALVAMVPSGAVYYWLYDMLKEKHLKHVSTTTGGVMLALPCPIPLLA